MRPSNPQPGQPERLGKRPRHHQIVVLLRQLMPTRAIVKAI